MYSANLSCVIHQANFDCAFHSAYFNRSMHPAILGRAMHPVILGQAQVTQLTSVGLCTKLISVRQCTKLRFHSSHALSLFWSCSVRFQPACSYIFSLLESSYNYIIANFLKKPNSLKHYTFCCPIFHWKGIVTGLEDNWFKPYFGAWPHVTPEKCMVYFSNTRKWTWKSLNEI
jgi:hypothetical protein